MIGMIVKKIDPFELDVYNFRKEIICNDENQDILYLDTEVKYSPEIPEEVWKFSLKKWKSINFDSLYGLYIDHELTAISGAKLYGNDKNFLRLGMMYYVLKRHRKQIRSPLWLKDGLIETALKDYKNKIDYSFISIYPHNEKLKSWILAFSRQQRLGQLGLNGHLDLIKSFKKYDNDVYFNGVSQSIFYKTENQNTLSSVLDLIGEIQDK